MTGELIETMTRKEIDLFVSNNRRVIRAYVGSPDYGASTQVYFGEDGGRANKFIGPRFAPTAKGMKGALALCKALNAVGEEWHVTDGGKIKMGDFTQPLGPLWSKTPEGRREARAKARALEEAA